jgi:hypothetical protein
MYSRTTRRSRFAMPSFRSASIRWLRQAERALNPWVVVRRRLGAPNLGEDPREDVDGQRDWSAD